MNRKFRLFFLLVIAVILVSTLGFSMISTENSATLASTSTSVMVTGAASSNSVRIMIGGVVLTVELAKTAAAQERGLSGRSSLPSDQGMLFVFDRADYWSFWMIDMRFPLDIIWFNSTRHVVFSEPNLPPCTQQNCPLVTPSVKSMYVLEVNAGFMAAHQIRLGTTFVFLDH